MHEYITEKHPDKVEIFETCQKITLDTEHYWCYFKDGRVAEDLYATEATPFVGVFSKEQNGYKLADERVPYPTDDELIEKLEKIEVSGEDLKKSKWQLLAEAYING
jgi:hypothetical protein